jgi:phosphoribosylformimino-5-aminoimidazole carboxamide ribotide isomerase
MTMPDAQKLEGAISGRALYDGRIDPAEALAVLASVSKRPGGVLD